MISRCVSLVEVGKHDADGKRADGMVLRGPEPAGAVAQQHADVVIGEIRRHQVDVAVAVDVSRGHRQGIIADPELAGRQEVAVAVAQQHV